MNKKTLFILAAVLLLLAFVGGTLFYTSQKQETATRAVSEKQDSLHRMHSPTKGPA